MFVLNYQQSEPKNSKAGDLKMEGGFKKKKKKKRKGDSNDVDFTNPSNCCALHHRTAYLIWINLV